MKYAWIKNHTNHWKVSRMIKVLKVSSAGYYDWLKRPMSARAKANEFLDQKIKEIFDFHRSRYGQARIWPELLAAGVHCSYNRFKRRYRLLGLKAKGRKKFKVTTDSGHNLGFAPNLLNRDFRTTNINQKWVGDITYIPTEQGWLYLAVLIDLHSRTVVGWAMSKRINQMLVCDALEMALRNRGYPTGVIIHSDRGSQYCSKRYQKLLTRAQLKCSMSRKGNCWDNAVAESFFGRLKVELIHDVIYLTRDSAKSAIFEYIETYYNRIRRHSALDYRTPYEVECEVQLAA